MNRGTESSTRWDAAAPSWEKSEIDTGLYENVLDLVGRTTARWHNETAFLNSTDSLTFRQTREQAENLARYLGRYAGILPGDRIAVLLSNVLEFPVCLLGVLRSGGVQVSINPQYTSRELHNQLKDSGARLLIVNSSRVGGNYLAGTAVERVLVVGATSEGLWDCVPSMPFDSALQLGAAVTDWSPPTLSGGDLAVLQYTGGTTGISKGAELTHANMIACILQFHTVLGSVIEEGKETILTVLPFYHIIALAINLLTFMSFGARNLVLENPRDPDALADALFLRGVSVITGVNTLYGVLLDAPHLQTVDLRRIKLAIGGGGAVQRAISEAWHARSGRYILEGYGLTEATGAVCINSPEDPAFSGTVGIPFPSTKVLILDDDGNILGCGQEGEISVKGPQIMRGYWNKPDETAAAFTSDGYLRTGDIGAIDERGYIRVCDRKKDMLIVSGFNVYPNEIEGVIAELAEVAECAVMGVPDPKTGEAVKVFVVRRTPSLTEAEIIAHCRGNLTGYKVPRIIQFIESLPKSPVGKILRRELRST